MKNPTSQRFFSFTCFVAFGFAAPSIAESQWDKAAAANYMDERQAWWIDWPVAARDQNTACQSCHTTVPYLLARPALRHVLGEVGETLPETRLISDTRKRVTMWNEIDPFYPDQTFGLPKSSESRGTEAILNAFVLASRDAREGYLASETLQAFENLWDLQFTRGEGRGAWAWLYFDLAPWESKGASYFGAALAAIAVGMAPQAYAELPEIQESLTLLRDYLLEDWQERPTFDRLMLLWAGSELRGLVDPADDKTLLKDLERLQNEDGGWSLAALRGWKGREEYIPPTESDGYATGLIAFVLQQAGVATEQENVVRALDWLVHNQDVDGRWPSASLNRERDPESERGRIMSDAATAFAVLALTEAQRAGH
jgi:hypothetical protein